MDLEDLIFADQGEGWQHLSRISRHEDISKPLPEETLSYFKLLAKTLIDVRTELEKKDASASTIKKELSKQAIRQLKIARSAQGNPPNRSKDLNALRETKQWAYALRVYELLASRKHKNITSIYQQVGIEFGDPKKDGHAIDIGDISNAWNELKYMVIGSINEDHRQ